MSAWPRVIRFEDRPSHSLTGRVKPRINRYSHAADVIIGPDDRVVKDRGGLPGRMATEDELAECVLVTNEMCREDRQRMLAGLGLDTYLEIKHQEARL